MIFGIFRKTRPSLIALALVSACFASPSVAQDPALSVPQLVAALAQGNNSTVRFSEERRLQYLTESLIVQGTLTFKPPNHLERLVLQPRWERMLITGDLLTIEKNATDPPTRVLLADYPVLDARVSSLRSLFSGDLEALQSLFEVSLDTQDEIWLLYLAPLPEPLKEAVREIQIGGSGDQVLSITVIESGGDVSVISILGRV